MKINGYRPSFRNRWLLLQEGFIDSQTLLFWEYCLDQMAYDRSNSGYGTAVIEFDEVMSVFRVKSLTTVRTWYNNLIRLGLVTVVHKQRRILQISHHQRYIYGGNGDAVSYESAERNQPVDVIAQSIGLINQSIDQNTANSLKSTTPKAALGSSTVSLFPISKQEVRTMAEYQLIHDNGDYLYLQPEDMAWIDQHLDFHTPPN